MRATSVCIDGRMLDEGGTGVSSYARALLRTLEDAGMTVGVLRDGGAEARRARPGRLAAAARWRARQAQRAGTDLVAPDLFREAQVHFNLYGRLLPVACDRPRGIMHWTYPVPLRMVGWRNLYTIHDAIPLVHPDLTPIDPRRHRRLLDRIVEHADRLVTVSDHARGEIVGALGCDPALVASIWQAVDVAGPPAAALPVDLERRRFLLFCGTIEPRKNLTRLIEAYRASAVALPLVLVGPAGWRGAPILDLAARTPGVIHLAYRDRRDLLALIAGARALLFPTLAEGFGLPVAEAMALGTPALTSAEGAGAEIAGDAGLAVDPCDQDAIGRAIGQLATDDGLCDRLRHAGLARAEAFTASRYADRLIALYAAVAHGE